MNLFKSSLNCYENQITHILVRNNGLCYDWEALEENELVQAAIKKYGVKAIDFPKLGDKERTVINQKRLRFDEARKYSGLGILSKQRVVNFLKAAYQAFDSAGVWSAESTKVASSE